MTFAGLLMLVGVLALARVLFQKTIQILEEQFIRVVLSSTFLIVLFGTILQTVIQAWVGMKVML